MSKGHEVELISLPAVKSVLKKNGINQFLEQIPRLKKSQELISKDLPGLNALEDFIGLLDYMTSLDDDSKSSKKDEKINVHCKKTKTKPAVIKQLRLPALEPEIQQ